MILSQQATADCTISCDSSFCDHTTSRSHAFLNIQSRHHILHEQFSIYAKLFQEAFGVYFLEN